MSITEAGARILAIVAVVAGVVVVAVAFGGWYSDAHEGFGVDDAGPLAAVLASADEPEGGVVIAKVIDDDCAEAVVIAPGTPTEVYEPLVGNADSDVSDRDDVVLVVVLDQLGSRVHAEHLPIGATGVADESRRLECNRPYTFARLQRAG